MLADPTCVDIDQAYKHIFNYDTEEGVTSKVPHVPSMSCHRACFGTCRQDEFQRQYSFFNRNMYEVFKRRGISRETFPQLACISLGNADLPESQTMYFITDVIGTGQSSIWLRLQPEEAEELNDVGGTLFNVAHEEMQGEAVPQTSTGQLVLKSFLLEKKKAAAATGAVFVTPASVCLQLFKFKDGDPQGLFEHLVIRKLSECFNEEISLVASLRKATAAAAADDPGAAPERDLIRLPHGLSIPLADVKNDMEMQDGDESADDDDDRLSRDLDSDEGPAESEDDAAKPDIGIVGIDLAKTGRSKCGTPWGCMACIPDGEPRWQVLHTLRHPRAFMHIRCLTPGIVIEHGLLAGTLAFLSRAALRSAPLPPACKKVVTRFQKEVLNAAGVGMAVAEGVEPPGGASASASSV